ncbi:MAG TPA: polyhydroxyalkanoate synthesis repressor PhaR [Steroidobacteraceae bacterium]|nr:polyhydroxyalkanoate synthesis repressor PhaR [Steroidobacteraceae bacterium]
MSEPRVIKKYPNRRLYDTVESRYITLADVQRLVVEKIDFVVVDKKNNADITRSILLQVISEQEHQVEPILTQEFMIQIIRSHGGNLQDLVGGYLEQSMKHFMSHQTQIRDRVNASSGADQSAQRAPSAVRMREMGRDLAREISRDIDKDRLEQK